VLIFLLGRGLFYRMVRVLVFRAGEMVIFQDRDGPNFPGGVEEEGEDFHFPSVAEERGGGHSSSR
jgi:hypothetical protein